MIIVDLSFLALVQYSLIIQAVYTMSVFWTTLLFSATPLFDLSHLSTDALAFSPPQLQLSNFFKPATESKSTTFRYTHLEGNGQLWQATTKRNTRASIVVDPIASQLDFGIPNLYRANKNVLSERQTIDLICDANPSHCLLTMGLDDHTHLPTLERLQARMPELRYVIAPSCERKLLEFGLSSDFITVLDHGEVCMLAEGVTVMATEGALVGPPWQKRENGYILELNSNSSNNNNNNNNNYPFNNATTTTGGSSSSMNRRIQNPNVAHGEITSRLLRMSGRAYDNDDDIDDDTANGESTNNKANNANNGASAAVVAAAAKSSAMLLGSIPCAFPRTTRKEVHAHLDAGRLVCTGMDD